MSKTLPNTSKSKQKQINCNQEQIIVITLTKSCKKKKKNTINMNNPIKSQILIWVCGSWGKRKEEDGLVEVSRVGRGQGMGWWEWGMGRWSGLGLVWMMRVSSLGLLSLSLSLSVWESKKSNLKVNQICNPFCGLRGEFYSQSLKFSVWLYFTCAPKHASGCKIFSQFFLHPKQTRPK